MLLIVGENGALKEYAAFLSESVLKVGERVMRYCWVLLVSATGRQQHLLEMPGLIYSCVVGS